MPIPTRAAGLSPSQTSLPFESSIQHVAETPGRKPTSNIAVKMRVEAVVKTDVRPMILMII